MKLPSLHIGDLEIKIPIVQGGMGVRISRAGLASAVTNAGGLGTISGVGIGPVEDKTREEFALLNASTLKEEIKKAKKATNGGVIAVNILVAQTDYEPLVKSCIEAGADIIVSGAGLPFMLPEYTKGTNIKLIPIVSSGRAAKVIAEKWYKRSNHLPDAFIVEGVLAGGHIGFSYEQLQHPQDFPLEGCVTDVLSAAEELKQKYGKKIPVIAAGGIFDGKDIARFLKLGASGVQMATRFVCTNECDAAPEFKQAYLDAKSPDDVTIIKSPVQMPGRVIRNAFVKNVIEANKKVPFKCNYHCLHTCIPNEVPYCIARVLFDASAGKLDSSFAFAGANVYRCNKIVHVQELIHELVTEAEEHYK